MSVISAALLLFTDWRAPYSRVIVPLHGSGETTAVIAPLPGEMGAKVRTYRPNGEAELVLRWNARLPVYPTSSLLSESGAFVGIGRYPSAGPDHALMVISPTGRLLADLNVESFLSVEALRKYREAQAAVEGLRYASWFVPGETAFHCSNQFTPGFLPDDFRHRDPQNLSPDILLLRTLDGGRLAVDTKSGRVATVRP